MLLLQTLGVFEEEWISRAWPVAIIGVGAWLLYRRTRDTPARRLAMNAWLLIRRLRGPAFLILVGITALLNQWGVLSFSRSWPLYLILAGVLGLAERAAIAAAPSLPAAAPLSRRVCGLTGQLDPACPAADPLTDPEQEAVMATLPPPYSQRDAARAQRYYRRSLRRPSMLGPLVLIVVGVIALLVETNQLNAVHLWDWYIRWWPLLLIGVGLLSLGEWWLDRASRRQRSAAALTEAWSRSSSAGHPGLRG